MIPNDQQPIGLAGQSTITVEVQIIPALTSVKISTQAATIGVNSIEHLARKTDRRQQ